MGTISNLLLTRKMLAYAKAHLIKAPHVSLNDTWGYGKRVLAWRVSCHMHETDKRVPRSTKRTPELLAKLFPDMVKPLVVLHPLYAWARPLGLRNGPPPGIVWHHSVGLGSALDIHDAHLRIGDRGIAYHYYVRRDGTCYAGRPETMMGAHCFKHNDTIGVCAEGNYDVGYMPDVQRETLRSLHHMLHAKYNVPDHKHRDMPDNNTACPGRFYPFTKIIA